MITFDPTTSDHSFFSLIREVDSVFHQQWGPQMLRSSKNFQKVLPSADHFVLPILPLKTSNPNLKPSPLPAPLTFPLPPLLDRKVWRPPDFISAQPMFQLVQSHPAKDHPSSIVKLFRTHVDQSTPMFTPKGPNGKCELFCLSSTCQAPFNTCCVTTYRTNKHINQIRPAEFHHIDLADPYWKRHPEIFWGPVVDLLKTPRTSELVRPSEFFQKLTPTTNWS